MYSKAEAGLLGHTYVGPEHYLLGILRKGEGLAIQVLQQFSVDLDDLRARIEELAGTGTGPAINLLAPNDAAKGVLDTMKQVAHEMNHRWIGTEHLLLGLIRFEGTIAAQCLAEFGLGFEAAQAESLKMIEPDFPNQAAMQNFPFSAVVMETPRLLLRGWVEDDWTRLMPMLKDPEVARFLDDGQPWPDEKIQEFVNTAIRDAKVNGWTLWPIVAKPSYQVIGFCGYNDRNMPDLEIGWLLMRDAIGQGYGAEAAQACIRYGFNVLACESVQAESYAEDAVFRGMVEGLGFKQTREMDLVFRDSRKTLVRYTLTRDVWMTTQEQ